MSNSLPPQDLSTENRRKLVTFWILLGVSLAVAFSELPTISGYVQAFTPWTIGSALLLWPRSSAAIARGMAALSDDTGLRISLGTWSVLGVVMAHVFSVPFAVFALSVVTLLGLLLTWLRTPATASTALVGLTLLAISTAFGLSMVEVALRTDVVAQRIGTEPERKRWRAEVTDRVRDQNILGIRSRHEDTRRMGGLRILALGDSLTWGQRVARTDDVWPSVLEAILNQRTSIEPLEVINLGRSAYSTVNEGELLDRLGWQFEPDVLVVQYFINDILPGTRPGLKIKGSRWLCPARLKISNRFTSGTIHDSALLGVVERQYSQWANPEQCRDAIALYSPLYAEGQSEWAVFGNALDGIAAGAAERDIPVVLMIFPKFLAGTWTDDTLPGAEIYERVAARGSEAGMEVLSLVPQFLERDLSDWWATRWDAHPGVDAHRVAAETLADFLIERGIVPTRARDATSGSTRVDPRTP